MPAHIFNTGAISIKCIVKLVSNKKMARLLLLLSIIPVFSQDIFGTFYSFDVDFYRTFNDMCCENKTSWYLVGYSSLGVLAPEYNDLHAVRASENSCMSSFPFALVPNSYFELLVYLSTVSATSGVVVTILSKDDSTPLFTQSYNSSSHNFVSGWFRIKIDIDIGGLGYINVIGKSQENELVLIDSIHFTPNIQKYGNEEEKFDAVDEIIFSSLKTNMNNTYNTSNDRDTTSEEYDPYIDYHNPREGSADGPSEDEEFEEIETDGISLGLWTIILISVVAITALALVGVGCYCLGKIKARSNNDEFRVDIEPENVVNIPRARPISTVNIRNYY